MTDSASEDVTMPITPAQVRGARAMLNMSQDQLAEVTGLKRLAISRLETGVTDPHGSTLDRIQAALEEAGAFFMETDAGVGVLIGRDDGR
jgi:predicted transcriptional regulator